MDPPCCSVPGCDWLVGRAAGPLGGCGDVTEHPAEYDAVERRYGSPVRVSGEPARLEDSPLAVGGHAVMVSADRHFEPGQAGQLQDRKSTRLNSSHVSISYAVFCLKKKKIKLHTVPHVHIISLAVFQS